MSVFVCLLLCVYVYFSKNDTVELKVPISVCMLWLAYSKFLFKAVIAEANSLAH